MMAESLPEIIAAGCGLHLLVIGEALLDAYLEGTAGRLCPEAPAPVVDVAARLTAPGGAANAAANAAALGARVTFLSVVGDDPEGAALRADLEAAGVSPGHVLTQPGRRTLAKQRVCAAGQVLCRLDAGDTGPVGAAQEDELLLLLGALWASCDAVLLSDYGYGVLTPRVVEAVAALQARRPRVVVADSKRLAALRSVAPTAVKPNRAEALRLLGLPATPPVGGRAAALAPHGPRLLELTGARALAALAALLARAPLLIANNTGPVHIAAAVATPVVDLYALTNPQHTPWAVPHRVLNHAVPCRNCYKSVCPEGHHDCLRLVPPDAIVRAACELLFEGPDSEPRRADDLADDPAGLPASATAP
jgi:rfaE bifunctional protein kinase chain/domain